MSLKDILNIVKTDDDNTKDSEKQTIISTTFITNSDSIKIEATSHDDSKTPLVCNFDDSDELGVPKIKVIGVGGAGNNIIDYLEKMRSWPKYVDLWALNTDKKTLCRLKKKQISANLFLLGASRLKGFGSGGDPKIGKEAFNENKEELTKIFVDTDVAFIIAGLGKGTGSGAGPQIAKIAKEKGLVTISIITMPSIRIEGEKTYENAFASKKEFIENCDSVCTIFNDKIVDEISESTFFTQLEQGNKEIGSIVSDFVDIISGAGEINIDFNDLKSFLTGNESSEGNKAFFHTKIIIDENVKDFSSLSSLVKEKINKSYSNGDFSSEKIDVLVNFKMGTSNKSDLVVNIKNILTDISSSSNIKLVYGIENTLETFTQISIFISTNEVSNYIPLKQDIQNDEVNANDKNVLNSSYSAKQAERNKTKNISKLLFDFDEFEK